MLKQMFAAIWRDKVRLLAYFVLLEGIMFVETRVHNPVVTGFVGWFHLAIMGVLVYWASRREDVSLSPWIFYSILSALYIGAGTMLISMPMEKAFTPTGMLCMQIYAFSTVLFPILLLPLIISVTQGRSVLFGYMRSVSLKGLAFIGFLIIRLMVLSVVQVIGSLTGAIALDILATDVYLMLVAYFFVVWVNSSEEVTAQDTADHAINNAGKF